MIYLDPPSDVGADFTARVHIGDENEAVNRDQSALEMVAYRDTWGRGADSYLQMLYERLVLMRELLAGRGSIYVHVGPNVACLAKLLMDDVFGRSRGISDIAWKRTSPVSTALKRLRPGQLDDLVLAYLRKHKDDGPLS